MFKNIKASNFFSWESLAFDFEKGVTLITGHNQDDNTSEGSGKSSTINALAWCLYGQIPGKDINTDDVVREGTKTCVVQTTLDSGHVIVRSRGPNDLYILDPDGTKCKGKDIKDTQRKIVLLLGMSLETFAQSVFFAQNYPNKFITASQEEKVKVLSEIQDLSWCDRATKAAYEKYKEASLEINKLDFQLKSKEETKGLLKAQLHTFNEMNTKFETDKSVKIANLKKKMDSNATEIASLESQYTALGPIVSAQAVKDRIAVLEMELSQLNTLMAHITALRQQYEAARDAKECPTCGQSIHKKIEEPVYPEDPEKVIAAISVRRKELEETRKDFSSLVDKESTSKEVRFKMNYLRAQNIELQDEITKSEHSDNAYTDKIEALHGKVDALEKEISHLQQATNDKHSTIESLKVLREGFKELKSHMFRSLLMQLNSKANRYIQELFDVSASIHFTNISEDDEISKIITNVIINGNERSLGLLSGGQFRRVQIAVDFALSEIVSERTGNPINVRILDEPFKDSSEEKVEKIIQILEKMPGCTVIIEHNSLIKSIVHNVFDVHLTNGISYHS